jgi:hypothetical protein
LEKVSWQAKAPAPRAGKSLDSKVGQALSPADPRADFFAVPHGRNPNALRSRDREGAVVAGE